MLEVFLLLFNILEKMSGGKCGRTVENRGEQQRYFFGFIRQSLIDKQ
jgi:hypothetical protein